MMHKIYLLSLHLLLLLLLCFNPLTTVADDNSTTGGIDGWCDQTPYPDPCKCYFKNHNGFLLPTQLSEFRIMLVEATMDRAISARDELAQSSRNCTDCRKQAVLADCIDLYGDTIVQLTRTLEGVSPKAGTGEGCTDFDAQTWLSTALTNTETCRRGSSDLNVSDFITPIVSNTKISNLISNCLAVNGSLLPTGNNGTTTADGKGFPTWVSSKERRLLQLQSARAVRANLVVAKDGSGQVNTVQAAVVDVAGRRKVTSGRYIIYVKKRIYQENINVRLNNDNIMLVGDGMRSTIITGTILSSVKGGYTTYNSATAGIEGLHFIAKGLTFQNTAGPAKGQAVELRSSSDLSIFYKCSIEGYQDTLMVHSQRQFYRGCYIYGTVDFIFGNAAVVFQNCLILPRPPLKGQANVITAQGRADPFQNTGISIHNSRIQPAPDLKPVVRTVKTYMGRPWMKYSRTVVLKTHLDSAVSPLGWSPGTEGSVFGLDTLFCAEYKNTGPGSSTKWRVRWKGFHVLNRDSDASAFTVGRFIASTVWLPHTGVPFTSGL
ncbi:PREDICTED: probable pectinesterase/pectinesterase inhibitor 59 [Brassica oleracea var. oleracea]|uniref:probable pectinesterase/pectinesterase inhibitor 59 n=1 Tax=Brassica oleracea var. oleracea TaxID=109376 RepID=UPI0006A757C2|nr:PREDICTED: probable pectinesterase/pectinesterase inhibitor 59 [Brassica oleracea var. oleracea]